MFAWRRAKLILPADTRRIDRPGLRKRNGGILAQRSAFQLGFATFQTTSYLGRVF